MLCPKNGAILMQITSRSAPSAVGLLNRWSGVQSSHPAPQQNQGYLDSAGFSEASREAESAESAESRRDLRYRKSGHSGRCGHVFDQRLEISSAAIERDEKPAAAQDIPAAPGSAPRSQNRSHDSDLFDILVASLLTHPPANPRARARFEAACEAVPEPEPDEEIEEDGAPRVTVADDPLLAKLRGGAR